MQKLKVEAEANVEVEVGRRTMRLGRSGGHNGEHYEPWNIQFFARLQLDLSSHATEIPVSGVDLAEDVLRTMALLGIPIAFDSVTISCIDPLKLTRENGDVANPVQHMVHCLVSG